MSASALRKGTIWAQDYIPCLVADESVPDSLLGELPKAMARSSTNKTAVVVRATLTALLEEARKTSGAAGHVGNSPSSRRP
jgi:hypothetical protein